MSRRDTDELVAALAEEYPPNASGWIRIYCPFCADRGYHSKGKNLAINPDSGAYVCWRKFDCGTAGNFRPDAVFSDAYTPVTSPPTESSYARVWSWLGAAAEADAQATEAPLPRPVDIEGYIPLDPSSPWAGMPFLLYLKRRGVKMGTVVAAQLGYATEGRYAHCVIIPIVVGGTYTGQAVYRDIREDRGKTINKSTSGYDRRLLLNEDALYVETDAPLAIVEGEFDALPHWPHAVPLSGQPSDAQIDVLARAKRPLVMMLDGDMRAANLMTTTRLRVRGANVRAALVPPGKDPGDLPHNEFITLLQGTP